VVPLPLEPLPVPRSPPLPDPECWEPLVPEPPWVSDPLPLFGWVPDPVLVDPLGLLVLGADGVLWAGVGDPVATR
jgi:hypothetical protein